MLLFLLLYGNKVQAQSAFIAEAPPEKRVQALWQYCDKNLISDPDSTVALRFLATVAATTDSLGDASLKRYAAYFRIAYRVLFSSSTNSVLKAITGAPWRLLNKQRHGHLKKAIPISWLPASTTWDKALNALLSAVRYPFFLPHEKINTYNSIGLIYGRKGTGTMPYAFTGTPL